MGRGLVRNSEWFSEVGVKAGSRRPTPAVAWGSFLLLTDVIGEAMECRLSEDKPWALQSEVGRACKIEEHSA